MRLSFRHLPTLIWFGFWFGLICLITASLTVSTPLLTSDSLAAPESISLETSVQSASGGSVFAYNGDTLTYTIRLTNTSANQLDTLVILNRLPADSLSNIQCTDGCQPVTQSEIVNDPRAGAIVVTSTVEISWSVVSLAPGASVERQFQADLICQPDGATVDNTVFVNYEENGQSKSGTDSVSLGVRSAVVTGVGFRAVSRPVWCSTGERGVYDVDWGDFDQDGDFDLALAGVGGTIVYQNDDGALREYWRNTTQSFGVRWADAIRGNGLLELISVGEGPVSTTGSGTNTVYVPDSGGFTAETSFTSASALFHLAVGDYNSDGLLDVAAININVSGCLASLYQNSGAAVYVSDTCPLASGEVSGNNPQANALAWADYDNDGQLDLAVAGRTDSGGFVTVRRNSNGSFSEGTTLSNLPAGNNVEATSLAWGDYDGDGFLDVAVGFQRSDFGGAVRIYRNNGAGGFDTTPIFDRTTTSQALPVTVEWADLNQDGHLDLIILDEQPQVHLGPSFNTFLPIGGEEVTGQIWAVAVADYDGNGSLDVAFANRDDSSRLYPSYSPFLSGEAISVHSGRVSSVAWGDYNADGLSDLLFGAGPGSPAVAQSSLYLNSNGSFGGATALNGFGPRQVAFGDVNGDNLLDVAFATTGQNEVYLNGSTSPSWVAGEANLSQGVAWGDVDNDDDLDMVVANQGVNSVYYNSHASDGGTLATTPGWQSSASDDSQAVAVADFNRDGYLDFAIANHLGPVRVYCNNRDSTFSPAWSNGTVLSSTDVAWADYDLDGDLDLAVSYLDQPTRIYANLTCQNKSCTDPLFPADTVSCTDPDFTLSGGPVWESAAEQASTSLAWGDWNLDGRPDLAVGNANQPDEVYANVSDSAGETTLVLRWQSSANHATSDVAWGDVDNDGDLDLAFSQSATGGTSGYYANHFRTPAHLSSNFTPALPLPQTPPYVSLARPGDTPAAAGFAVAEVLTASSSASVPIPYTVFDPSGSRNLSESNASGRVYTVTAFEYSLDGGLTWATATPAQAGPALLNPTRQGTSYTFHWDAQADQAVSDNARFRLTLQPWLGALGETAPPADQVAGSRYASVQAVSPLFRVRSAGCLWPAGALITYEPTQPAANEVVQFQGYVTGFSGRQPLNQLEYAWDFDDGSATAYGARVQHTFTQNDAYTVRLSIKNVANNDCQIVRETSTFRVLLIGGGPTIYLPLVMK